MRKWLPLAIGFLAGMLGGLYYAWVANPVEYVDASPASLREDFKSDYLSLIASAYAATGDLDRAQARLDLFPNPDTAQALGALAQRRLALGYPEAEARALALLAAALGERPTPIATRPRRTPTAARPSPTVSPTGTTTPTPVRPPTRTPTATPGAPFRLVERGKVCDPDLASPLIQVEVLDAAGKQIPGVEVLVVWDTGQDHFFTGLKPELGVGYGDFTMTEGLTYTVQVRDSDELVTGLIIEDCVSAEGELFLGSWLLRFAQPSP